MYYLARIVVISTCRNIFYILRNGDRYIARYSANHISVIKFYNFCLGVSVPPPSEFLPLFSSSLEFIYYLYLKSYCTACSRRCLSACINGSTIANT